MSRCTFCKKRDAIFMRSYSGEKLCQRCFSLSIRRKVRSTISRYEMFKPDDKIMVAVSGGKDSLTLLHVLTKIERAFPKVQLSAITIDEGIRDYRDESMKLAEKYCAKFDVKHTVVSFKEILGSSLEEIVNISRGKGLTPCSYCGVLRRRLINITARKKGVDKIATAHNLDDETQTMLLNIFHGDALRITRVKPALEKVHPKLIPRVKPLCEVLENEISLYTFLNGIEFQDIPCPYAGNALRNDIRTMLNRMETKHPGMKFTVFRTMEKLRQYLEPSAKKAQIRECEICGEPTVEKICRSCHMLQDLTSK